MSGVCPGITQGSAIARAREITHRTPDIGWVGNDDFTITNLTTSTSVTGSNNNTNSGWLVGAGIEWAFLPNWSAKVEYNYLGLDDRTFVVPAGSPFLAGDIFTQSNRNIQILKVGINYRFNWNGYRY
jgi:outer membrane immunogenic protein